MNKHFSLYIHIPFCVTKCHYCDFISYAGKDDKIPAYFNALNREAETLSAGYTDRTLDTIFIGGGTPSYVPAHYIGKILETVNANFTLNGGCEISMETNPGTLTEEKCAAYRSYGINRISMGVQAAQSRLLSMLGRSHTFEDAQRSVDAIRRAGFDNLNMDVMFGLPGQTPQDWYETLDKVLALRPEHISAYSLIIEEGTPFYASYPNYEQDDADRAMYHYLLKLLAGKKYLQYEISNFASAGKECKHNLYCWDMEEYLGIGLNAHSFIGTTRFANEISLDEYLRSIQDKGNARGFEESLTARELMGDYLMLALRKTAGIDLTDFKASFNVDLMSVFHNEADNFIKKNLLELKNGSLRLTRKGLDYASYVMRAFL